MLLPPKFQVFWGKYHLFPLPACRHWPRPKPVGPATAQWPSIQTSSDLGAPNFREFKWIERWNGMCI